MNTPRIATPLAAGMLALACASVTQVAAADNPLLVERWQTRPLIVVSPTADHPLLQDLQSQLRATATQQGLQEREMVLFTVVAGQGRRAELPLSPAQSRALLAALGGGDDGDAQVFLVGKDGGIKLKERGERVSLAEIFTLIDGMPMRRR